MIEARWNGQSLSKTIDMEQAKQDMRLKHEAEGVSMPSIDHPCWQFDFERQKADDESVCPQVREWSVRLYRRGETTAEGTKEFWKDLYRFGIQEIKGNLVLCDRTTGVDSDVCE